MNVHPSANYARILFVLLISTLVWACQSNTSSKPASEAPYAAMTGKEVYDMYCVACHGADGKMMFSGATDLSKSVMDLDTRILQIANGKGVMNAFKGILSQEEIENVAVYIEELRVAE